MASPLPNVRVYFADENGAPLVGGKVYTYAAGSGTPKATYTTKAATVENTNPVVLDARGEADIWLGDGGYKIVVKNSADVLRWERDNIESTGDLQNTILAQLAASSGSSLVGFIQAGSTASARTVQAKLRDVALSVKDFGAVGDGVTDDSAAFTKWATEITERGGGNALIPPGNYKVFAPIGGALVSFSNSRVTLYADGVTLTDSSVYTAGQFSTLFQLTTCAFDMIGKPKIVTQQQDIAYSSDLGLSAFVFEQGCVGVSLDFEISGGKFGALFTRLSGDPVTYKSSRIRLGMKATRTHYPYCCQFSGDDAVVDIDVVDCGRNFFIYGIRDNKINIRSKNQKVTSLIKAYSGQGCDGVDVALYDRESDSLNSAAPLLSIEWGDSTAATHRNIKIKLNSSNPSSFSRGHTIAFAKYSDGGSTADSTGRGHVLDGFSLSGTNDNSTAAVNHVNLDAGAFAAPDIFRNIAVENFSGLGSSSNIYLPLQSLNDTSVWKNVVLRSGNIYTNNASSGKVVFVGCVAGSFTAATSSTDTHDYVSCDIYDGALQNTADNKRFVNTKIAGKTTHSYLNSGAFYQTQSVQRVGDQSVAMNIFKIPAIASGLFIRLHYYLVYDQAEFSAAARRETAGIKSFSVTVTSAGVISLQTPIADDVTERTLGATPAVLSVSLVSGDATGAFISVAATNYNIANSRGQFALEAIPMARNTTMEAV